MVLNQSPQYALRFISGKYQGGEFPLRMDREIVIGKLFACDRPSRALSAEVDPDHVLLLDVDRTNNSQHLQPQTAKAGRQWAGRWWVWLQDVVVTYAFFL